MILKYGYFAIILEKSSNYKYEVRLYNNIAMRINMPQINAIDA